MDQMPALRQIAAKGQEIASSSAYLFQPGETLAIRPGSMNGTPLPHEEPQELNPPAGVVAYYWLKNAPSEPVKIELVDGKGTVRACAASDTAVHPVDTEAINVQAIWQEPTPPPSAQAGMHRTVLNVAAPRFGEGPRSAPAVRDACSPPAGTPTPPAAPRVRGQRGPGALQPGEYTVRLTVDGKSYTQGVTVKPDPRPIPVDHANEGGGDHF